MTEEILKTSEQWQADAEHTWVVVDPDGWDRANFQYSFFEELITEEEFMKRLVNSTLIMTPKRKSVFD